MTAIGCVEVREVLPRRRRPRRGQERPEAVRRLRRRQALRPPGRRPGVGQASAKVNDRDTVEPWDLPITKGLQESVHGFRRLDEEVELKPILEQLAAHPPLDRTPAQETEERYPEIIGGLSVALAETFKIIYPDVKNPQTSHWEGVTSVFDRLL
ncbi:DUF1931 family protein [Streptomyces hirsutus]|uniref:DUF1931 family protein n=1 Tax=Streptomyces hirsutus TaxID=35620 RepID=UPI003D9FA1AA